MSGLTKCVRCGETQLHNLVAEGEIQECEDCGEVSVMDFTTAADIINEIYSQTNEGLDFEEWLRRINREEFF